MTPEQKEKLISLIKEYSEDCDYLSWASSEGTQKNFEAGEKYKAQSLERINNFIEGL